ncbi:MAG: S26 family signal peptidase [Chloroflexi bacterium]|nr:S26 family signal peptidase [Chloroflexota bacterium]
METSLSVRLLQKTLAQGQYVTIKVNGRSMSPLLQLNDLIVLEPIHIDNLNKGDIVTIISQGQLLTHRFYSFCNSPEHLATQLCTRGDRSKQDDPTFPSHHLVGRVVQRKRNNQTMALTTGFGFRLNQHLTWLAITESWIYTHLKADKELIKPSPLISICNHLFHQWSKVVTKLFEVINYPK